MFTRRACAVEEIYHELGRRDPAITDEQISLDGGLLFTESEKLILTVIAMQLVDRTFECNVHRFKMLIDKLKPTNSLDFKMLHGLLEQRHHQIAELLADGKRILTYSFRFH